MTLSRSTPLRSDPSHTFQEKGAVRTCEDCGAVWRTEYYDDPPPWPCTGLKRGSGLKRTRLSPVSGRRDEKRSHQKDEGFRDWIRRHPCAVCDAPAPSDPHHVLSWGAGHGDEDNLLPLCRDHHRQFHDQGRDTVEDLWGMGDLRGLAEVFGERYREEEG